MPWPNDSNPLFGGQAGSPLSNQHLSEHENIKTAVAGILTYLGLPPNIGASTLLSRLGITPTIGPIFWIGASYEDEKNAYYQLGSTGAWPFSSPSEWSDGHSWSALVSQYFGQPCIGRYTPQGNSFPFGQNYAISGAGSLTSGNILSITAQITQLISDYSGTLPSGSVVVIGGYWPNDFTLPLEAYGGVWAPPGLSWQVGPSGGFTTTVGSQEITVVSTAGMVAGATNYLNFGAGFQAGPFAITTVNDATHVTVTIPAGYGGFVVANSAPINQSAISWMQVAETLGNFSGGISNVVAALPSNGLLVIVTSPDVSLIPAIQGPGFPSLTNCHNTWLWYKNNIIAPFLATTAPKVAGYDMNQSLVDVVTTYPPVNGVPSKFGFKNVNAGLGGIPSTPVPPGYNASDWAFWDGTTGVTTTGTHPTGAMHIKYAHDFIQFLMVRKYLSLH
jgi:hypothetical protein